MDSFDRALTSAWRDFEIGMQQAVYYAIFIDLVLLIALGVFIWCCCVYVLNYKKLVDETIRIKRSEKQYLSARAERERLEAKRLKLELGLIDDINKVQRGLYGE
ncbi:hypothetical protein [Halomonas alkaliantarctica]|uniref:hypothetical protein n=1 Tax=Halomonas alkaliantarctica TaxID=232346 RepID=UPI0004AAA13D|nr:hypothetical protein [Halomonas alkaliantarctica]